MLIRTSRLHRGGPAARGLSIMELLIGIAVGMVVISGAAMLFARNLAGSKLLLAESRLNEDLRNAADLLTRDLRRGGYWGNAIKGTQAIGAGAITTANPYSDGGASAQQVSYRYSQDLVVAENDALDDNKEQFGFRLQDKAIQMQDGKDNWSDITDKTSVEITGFTVTPTVTTISLADACPTACLPGGAHVCPTATVRNYAVVLHGVSVRDPDLQRTLRSTVRVRNDQVSGTCP
jgi:prepilin peptidase dependent protein B